MVGCSPNAPGITDANAVAIDQCRHRSRAARSTARGQADSRRKKNLGGALLDLAIAPEKMVYVEGGWKPDWSDDSHSIACTIRPGQHHFPFWLHMMSNAYWEALEFELPDVPEMAVSGWRCWIDTGREPPEDITDPRRAPLVDGTQYRVTARSMATLLVAIDAQPTRASESRNHPLNKDNRSG